MKSSTVKLPLRAIRPLIRKIDFPYSQCGKLCAEVIYREDYRFCQLLDF